MQDFTKHCMSFSLERKQSMNRVSEFLKSKIYSGIISIFLVIHITSPGISIALSSISFGIWGGMWLIRLIVLKSLPDIGYCKKELKLISLFFAGFFLIEVLSRIFAIFPDEALISLKRYFLVLVFIGSIDIIKTEEKLKTILASVLIITSAIAMFEIAMYLIKLPGLISEGMNLSLNRIDYFIHPLTNAEIKSLVFLSFFPLIFNSDKVFKKEKILITILLIPIFISLFLTLSRNVYVALSITFLIYGIFFNRKFLLYLIPSLVIIWLLLPSPIKTRILSISDTQFGSNQGRIVMWETGWKIFLDHPLIGTGDNEITEVYKLYKKPEFHGEGSHFHSNPIQLLVTCGIFGFTFFYAFMAALFLKQISIYRKLKNIRYKQLVSGLLIAFIAYHIAGFFEWVFGDWEVLTVFAFISSISFIILNIETKINNLQNG